MSSLLSLGEKSAAASTARSAARSRRSPACSCCRAAGAPSGAPCSSSASAAPRRKSSGSGQACSGDRRGDVLCSGCDQASVSFVMAWKGLQGRAGGVESNGEGEAHLQVLGHACLLCPPQALFMEGEYPMIR